MQSITGGDLRKMLIGAARLLEQEKERVNALNVFPVPDGDTGTNMSLTLLAAVKELDSFDESESVGKVAAALARGSLMGARGNSGVILSQFFRGFSEGLKGLKEARGIHVARALQSASETTYRAVMKPVEGTMLTVGKAAALAAREAAEADCGADQVWEVALKAAQKALANTPNILPVLKQAGVVDAGGEGLVTAFRGALMALRDADYVAEIEAQAPPVEDQPRGEGITLVDGVLINKYCTEFFIRGSDIDIDSIRETLAKHGDSLLVVGDGDVVKVHVHTDHPGTVLEYCGEFGDLDALKIDNMKLQNLAVVNRNDNKNVINFPQTATKKQADRKPIGIVAVVPGSGLAEIFLSLGVDKIVNGGQTMNPSTEELVRAAEEVNADSVIILPNNKNVVFSAQQCKELLDKPIGVVATRSIPQGISALINFDVEKSLKANLQAMEKGMKQVKTGEVTYAVRSTMAGDLRIEEEDIIGLADGKIVTVGQSVNDVSLQLLEKMVDEDSSVVTVYSGENQDFGEAEQLVEEISERYPDCEVELYKGGQPLYYYILSVE